MRTRFLRVGLVLAGGLLTEAAAAQKVGPVLATWGDDDDEVLVGVIGAVRLDDGRMAILDQGARALLVAGDSLEVWAQPGPGPGELSYPGWIGRCDGRLAVYDVGSNNIVTWDDAGTAHEGTPLVESIGFDRVLTCRDGTLLSWSHRPKVRRFPPGAVFRDTAHLVRTSATRRDTLWRGLGDSFLETVGIVPVPLHAASPAAAGGGWVYVGDSGSGIIQVAGPDGRSISFRFQTPDGKVSRTAWETAKAAAAARTPTRNAEQVVTRTLRSAPRPSHYPAFGELRADRSGNLWVQLPGPDPSAGRWAIYTPAGQPVGQVRLEGTPLEIGSDYILLLR